MCGKCTRPHANKLALSPNSSSEARSSRETVAVAATKSYLRNTKQQFRSHPARFYLTLTLLYLSSRPHFQFSVHHSSLVVQFDAFRELALSTKYQFEASVIANNR